LEKFGIVFLSIPRATRRWMNRRAFISRGAVFPEALQAPANPTHF
jgi:hypothetical protein